MIFKHFQKLLNLVILVLVMVTLLVVVVLVDCTLIHIFYVFTHYFMVNIIVKYLFGKKVIGQQSKRQLEWPYNNPTHPPKCYLALSNFSFSFSCFSPCYLLLLCEFLLLALCLKILLTTQCCCLVW